MFSTTRRALVVLLFAATACSASAGHVDAASPQAIGETSGATASAGGSTSSAAGGADTTTTSAGTTAGTSTGTAAGNTTGGTTSTGTFSGDFLFSPYKDVSISTNWNTTVISTAVTGTLTPLLEAAPEPKAFTWAFATGECGSENWGGISGSALATANLPTWTAANKDYILSTGGASGVFTCGSDAGFSAFLDRYASKNLIGVDFDIEAGQTSDVLAALIARVKAAQSNPKYAKLRFSFTVATLGGSNTNNLGTMGVAVMTALQAGGLNNYFINLMTMDYGSALATNCTLKGDQCDMAQSAIQAAKTLNSTYQLPYKQIELTPMIGGNDTQGETFTLDDVASVMAFAKANGLGGVHIWSLDRDKDCAPGYASPTCNSFGTAGTLGFTHAFISHL
jgi:hypothetical protein